MVELYSRRRQVEVTEVSLVLKSLAREQVLQVRIGQHFHLCVSGSLVEA